MGCGASTQAEASLALKPAQAVHQVEQVKDPLVATAPPAATPTKTLDGHPTPARPGALDRVNTFGAGGRAQELESPNVRSTNKKKKKIEDTDDAIPTICSEGEEEEEEDTPQPLPPHQPAPEPTAVHALDNGWSEAEDNCSSPAVSMGPKVQQSDLQQPHPPDTPPSSSGHAGHPVTTGMSDSQDFERLAPPRLTAEPAAPSMLGRGQGGTGAGWASGRPASQVPTLPPLANPALPVYGKARYDDITLSDDDDDDDDKHGFDLERWRRFYKWNRTKPADLLDFLWRRFDPRHHSICCAAYKAHNNFFAGFQGENVMHGLCCRLEAVQPDLFAGFSTLYSCRADSYKVIGVLIFKGSEPPPRFVSMPDYEDYEIFKADTKDPAVRKFVGSLLTRLAPGPDLSVVCSQEYIGPV